MKLSGFEAIEFAEQEGLTLNKLADAVDGPATGLSVAEAEAIAVDDPDLIWLVVPEDEYYGNPRNMTPGEDSRSGPHEDAGRANSDEPLSRRAGLLRDELLPDESNADLFGSKDQLSGDAAGSPGGGLSASGLAGTTHGSGAPNERDLEDALGSDEDDELDDLADTIGGLRPESGHAGGAVGGTPAGKRVSPRKQHGVAEATERDNVQAKRMHSPRKPK